MCLNCFPQRCAISGEVKTFKTSNNRTFAQKCFVFLVDSDEDVRKMVQIVCDLFSTVTKPYMSKTGVAGRPHLGVPGNITGSVESGDLPEIITAVGPYKTAHIVGCLHHGELLYFGGSFDMEYAKKLVVEAFEEDTGLKVGSGVPRVVKRRRMRMRRTTRLRSRHDRQRQRMMRGSWERIEG